MPIGNPQSLKERVEVLETSMIAIDNLSRIGTASQNSGQNPIDLSDVVNLLAYLVETSMYQVEALREQILGLPSEIQEGKCLS